MRIRARLAVVAVTGAVIGTTAFSLASSSVSPKGSVTSTAAANTEVPASHSSLPPTVSTTLVVPTTTTTPPPTAATDPPEPEKGWLVIHGVGDTNFDLDYLPVFRSEGYEYAFAGLGGLFEEDDLTVVNLECAPSSIGVPLDKEFVFRCDPEALGVMRAHGIEVVNLANNHSQDFGVEALLDGRRAARQAGLGVVGVGVDLAEAAAPVIYEIRGWKVAVLGMGGVIPSVGWLATEDSPGMASGDDIEQMVASVRAAKEVADVVVVSIHWGWELEVEPRADDRQRAEAMVAAGADVIFGHHQHRLNPLELVDGRPVAWGLGNFVWPRLSHSSATTGIARVIVSPGGEFRACLIPAFIERSGQPVLSGPVPCAVPFDEPDAPFAD